MFVTPTIPSPHLSSFSEFYAHCSKQCLVQVLKTDADGIILEFIYVYIGEIYYILELKAWFFAEWFEQDQAGLHDGFGVKTSLHLKTGLIVVTVEFYPVTFN